MKYEFYESSDVAFYDLSIPWFNILVVIIIYIALLVDGDSKKLRVNEIEYLLQPCLPVRDIRM